MTKVVGPALSISASGSLQKKITFQKTPSGHKVYLDHSHKGIVSSVQSSQRSKFLECIQGWKELTSDEKKEWEDAAKGIGMTGYNYFLKDCLAGKLPYTLLGFLLMEDGDYLLCEDGSKIVLE
jgi:hypothetical protein